VPCDEINKKARALADSGKTEEARTFLNAAIQACTGARSDKPLAAALMTLGFIESTAQPREALHHFRRAMALDPENMTGPMNVGGMLVSLGQYTEALEVLEKALKHGTDDKDTLFRLEYNAGFALLKMCAARQAGCDRGRMEQHFVGASELNPRFQIRFSISLRSRTTSIMTAAAPWNCSRRRAILATSRRVFSTATSAHRSARSIARRRGPRQRR
jgi:tetratricopeptide (TPR) repeat protein